MNTSGSGSSGSSLPPSSAGPLAANIAAVSLKLPPYWPADLQSPSRGSVPDPQRHITADNVRLCGRLSFS